MRSISGLFLEAEKRRFFEAQIIAKSRFYIITIIFYFKGLMSLSEAISNPKTNSFLSNDAKQSLNFDYSKKIFGKINST